MTNVKEGDVVKVTVTGKVADFVGEHLRLVYSYPDDDPGHMASTHLFVGSDDVIVERIAPAEWPPEHNDLWRDRDGLNWVANTDNADDVFLYSTVGELTPKYVWDTYGPLALVYREPGPGGPS